MKYFLGVIILISIYLFDKKNIENYFFYNILYIFSSFFLILYLLDIKIFSLSQMVKNVVDSIIGV